MPAKSKHSRAAESYTNDTAIPKKLGGGVLKDFVKRDVKTKQVLRFALVYINHVITQKDNGRTLGYDDGHGYRHRHFLGVVTALPPMSYEAIADMFERQWRALARQHVNNEPLELVP